MNKKKLNFLLWIADVKIEFISYWHNVYEKVKNVIRDAEIPQQAMYWRTQIKFLLVWSLKNALFLVI